jgi:hypothetical protein
MPELTDEERSAVAAEDWEVDRQDKTHVNYNDFVLAIFKLCDVWTDYISGESYLEFLVQVQYTTHHTPYTIHHAPYTIHHTPYTTHHALCTMHHTPYTIHSILTHSTHTLYSHTLLTHLCSCAIGSRCTNATTGLSSQTTLRMVICGIIGARRDMADGASHRQRK